MRNKEEICHLELAAANYGTEPEYFVIEWQLRTLTRTLDRLVEQFNPKGIFYVNDLEEDHTKYATDFLKDYAKYQGYDQITIQALPGSYLKLTPPRVRTMHLKHPDPFTYRIWNLSHLQRLATFSETGLELTAWEAHRFQKELERKGLKTTYLGPGMCYSDPCGFVPPRPSGILRIDPHTEFTTRAPWGLLQSLLRPQQTIRASVMQTIRNPNRV